MHRPWERAERNQSRVGQSRDSPLVRLAHVEHGDGRAATEPSIETAWGDLVDIYVVVQLGRALLCRRRVGRLDPAEGVVVDELRDLASAAGAAFWIARELDRAESHTKRVHQQQSPTSGSPAPMMSLIVSVA